MAIPARRRGLGLDVYAKEQEQEKESENQNENNLLPSLEIEGDFNLTENQNMNEFLKKKAVELKLIQAKASLELGKLFIEVEETLGGKNQYAPGVYVKWLELNGYNKMTALRHKKRYRLFILCMKDAGKNLVATLPMSIINRIGSMEEKEMKELVSVIDEGITREELQNLLEEKPEILELDNKTTEIFSLETEIQTISGIFSKISFEKLEISEKENFEKDIKKIEKILKKYIK